MNRICLVFIAIIFSSNWSFTQSDQADKAISIQAIFDQESNSNTLVWTILEPSTTILRYKLSRKLENENVWTLVKDSIPNTETVFKDTLPSFDHSVYEYEVRGYVNGSASSDAAGYVLAGHNKMPSRRGAMLVLVEQSLRPDIEAELEVYVSDLFGDGWTPKVVNVDKSEDSYAVKGLISHYYNTLDNMNAIILIGHIPVHYSGWHGPDGHGPRAYPSDLFYSDIDGNWSDNSVDETSWPGTRNDNVLGDKVTDQSHLPSHSEVMIGRVDLSNIVAYPESEAELTKKYLTKNHEYRIHKIKPKYQGYIHNGLYSTPVRGGYASFPQVVGVDNITTSGQGYRTELSNDSYLTSQVICTAGYSHMNCAGHNFGGYNVSQMPEDSLQTIFTFAFGSYFGDWDSQNNFLRGLLCNGSTLTSTYMGWAPYYIHQMGLGKTIGHATRTSRDNNMYNSDFIYLIGRNIASNAEVHQSLMGDPTLRTYIYDRLDNVQITVGDTIAYEYDYAGSLENTEICIQQFSSELGSFVNVKGYETDLDEIPASLENETYKLFNVRLLEKGFKTPSGSLDRLNQGVIVAENNNADCNGIVNGLSVIDQCGECRSIFDPSFNICACDGLNLASNVDKVCELDPQSSICIASIGQSLDASYSYQWTKDNVIIPNETSHSMQILEPGTYQVTLLDEFGEQVCAESVSNELVIGSLDVCFEDVELVFNIALEGPLNNSQMHKSVNPYSNAPYNDTIGLGLVFSSSDSGSGLASVLLEVFEVDPFDNVLPDTVFRKVLVLRTTGDLSTENSPFLPEYTNLKVGKRYIFKLRHYSHLDIVTEPILLTDYSTVIDIANNPEIIQGEDQLVFIENKWRLKAGDIDGNGIINSVDYIVWKSNENADFFAEHSSDLNSDASIDQDDFDLWFKNRSIVGHPLIQFNY